MSFIELFLLALGVSMDAFAVSICKGLALPQITMKNACLVGGWFGSFQALMPLFGYLLGLRFQSRITAVDHWIAFFLLLILGIRMIQESQHPDDSLNPALDPKTMFLLAVATSIDALAVGITFAFLQVAILPAITFIGCMTFLFSFLGVKLGNICGGRFQSKAEQAGGFILILIGCKILLEHLNLLA